MAYGFSKNANLSLNASGQSVKLGGKAGSASGLGSGSGAGIGSGSGSASNLNFGSGNDSSLRGIGIGIINPFLLVCVLLLIGIGLVTLYSVTRVDTDYSFSRQVIGVAIGLVAMVAFCLFDYRKFSRLTIPLLILDAALILLPLIPGLGYEVNGATSWIKLGPLSFQPSELAKPVSILMLASFVCRFDGSITDGLTYLKAICLIAVPFVLLVKEDLGTALIILIIGFVILFVGGAHRRFLLVTVMAGALGIVGIFMLNYLVSDWTNGDIKLIKDYQMSRLLVFIDQDNEDYADDAYNLNQAKIAVGSGEVSGKGWGNATQSSGGFLPESATDFIFCVFAEEWGFLGAVVLLGLYLALLTVTLSIGLKSSDLFGSLIVAGIMAVWIFQIVENIGMDLGLMPITGIPLPFMSYGSSFMVTNFIFIGLLLSVWARRLSGGSSSGRASGHGGRRGASKKS